MTNPRWIFAFVALFAFGCGQNSNMVTLTIDPGMGTQNKVHQLAHEFFSLPKAIGGASCLQKNLVVGVKLGGDENDNSNLLTYPIAFRTGLCAACTTDESMMQLLNSNSSLDEPIKVSVPKGGAVEVGIIGTIAVPVDGVSNSTVEAGIDGYCDELDSSGNATPNFSVIGHRPVPTDNSTTVQINSWVLQANASPAPYSTPFPDGAGGWNPGSFYCPNRDVKEQCSYRDLIKLYTTGSLVKIQKVEYFFGKNRKEGAKQNLAGLATNNFFVPSIFPMVVTYTKGGGTSVITLFKSGSYDVSGGGNDLIVAQELGSN